MTSMRAVLIKDGKGPIENLHIAETAKPVPKDGEVLVKIKAFGLNRMDISQRLGHYPPPAGASDILGVEFSGTIVELGNGVEQWQVGDEVMGLVGGGAYAEYVNVPATHIMAKPKHLSWAEAASIPENWFTAFQAVVLVSEIIPGDNVLVHAGASGVGIAAIQLAHFYKANDVIATASTKEKLDWLLSLPSGATHAVNYKTQDFAEEVKKITNGKGVGVLVDFVGQSHWHKNIQSLGLDGRMTLLAALSGAEVPTVNLGPILFKRLRIQGSTLRSRSADYQSKLIKQFQQEVLQNITGSDGNGELRVYIHKVYPWTEIQEAHREMEANNNSGKIIVEVV
ncbi:quinone oxidoreductase putative [Cristinia sonorae]|uniref:Quinone oxidoreductase putative n=1 Tax=Cristinia sonorae TaxID=1940300 RepID=A0A8K0XLI3_9AGAR|nr:quinone oxidoreductase putative [Cristinia sonorae]